MSTKQYDLAESLNILAGTTGFDEQGAANAWANTSGYDTVTALNIKANVVDFDINEVCTKLLHNTATYASYPTGYDAAAALSILAGGQP